MRSSVDNRTMLTLEHASKNHIEANINKKTNISLEVYLKNTLLHLQSMGKAFIKPIPSAATDMEYMGAIKSGKAIYFTCINGEETALLPLTFMENAKYIFELGGAAFVLIHYNNTFYRVPYYIFEMYAESWSSDIWATSLFEIPTKEKIVDFLQKDIFECTIVGAKLYKETTAR